jgi:predicted RNA binding protein YcfA (HicA-like mRNA interferase family)
VRRSFADVDDPPFAVDVGDPQIKSFLATQPGAVEGGQKTTMLQVHRDIEQCADFFPPLDRVAPLAAKLASNRAECVGLSTDRSKICGAVHSNGIEEVRIKALGSHDQYTTIVRSKPAQTVPKHPKSIGV